MPSQLDPKGPAAKWAARVALGLLILALVLTLALPRLLAKSGHYVFLPVLEKNPGWQLIAVTPPWPPCPPPGPCWPAEKGTP